ncbi:MULTISPECIES: hypothetical protein [Burkholderia]|uniref:hypothetical protein n=1 Tax=Burkholderia TaxID=32008 RepID=UPI0016404C31|nr:MULTISPECIES: hypothetical protein [Burkholderia]MBR8206777.1 hypothetical protein [Burkholderia vietnamiensis]MCA8395738.1 hypothetical protein [Burkholderia vietnamiensis]MDN7754744.1 hypothetical protein [Burkholderia gladioli]HDR8962188.1 hypothetical protein [Burkholderia vietnamiensis]HDR9248213.1 hypothetical protein [Burkholderia vietnamiensis]
MKKTVLMLAVAGGTLLVQQAQADVVLDVNAPNCVAKGPDGKRLVLAGKLGGKVLIPRGSSFTEACFTDLSLTKPPYMAEHAAH